MTSPTGSNVRPTPWREWLQAIALDSIACGLTFTVLRYLFADARLGPLNVLAAGLFLGLIKLTLVPQYWLLLLDMKRRVHPFHERGAGWLVLRLLGHFVLAYAFFLAWFSIALFADPGSDGLLDLMASTWLDWSDAVGILQPAALLSCALTGPLVAWRRRSVRGA